MPCKEAGENLCAGKISLRLTTTEISMSTFETVFFAILIPGAIAGYLLFAEWMDDFCRRQRWLP